MFKKFLVLLSFLMTTLCFMSISFAEANIPTITYVYFEYDGGRYDHLVDYKITCGGTLKEDESTYEEYSYSATCAEYGCEVYEDYDHEYLNIDSCSLTGTTLGQSFIIADFASEPVSNCTTKELKVDCDMYFEIPVEIIFDTTFSDVVEKYKHYDAIIYVKDNGIVQGYDDGTYKPEKSINRAEFTKIIIGAVYDQDEIDNCSASKSFPDVSSSEWYAPYICVASNEGIISGYPDGYFRPANQINFVESSKIIAEAFDLKLTNGDTWYEPYIYAMELNRAIPITVDTLTETITRGEMAEMIFRLKEGITNKESAFIL